MFLNFYFLNRLLFIIVLVLFLFDYSYYVGFEVYINSFFLCIRNMYFINKNIFCWLLLFIVYVG